LRPAVLPQTADAAEVIANESVRATLARCAEAVACPA
jgi:hypothetical protein